MRGDGRARPDARAFRRPSIADRALRALSTLVALVAVASAPIDALVAQDPSIATATVAITVSSESGPLAGVLVRAPQVPGASARTDALGLARLHLPAGTHELAVARIGFEARRIPLTLRAGADTAIAVTLTPLADLETVVVEATRSGRRLEDEPLRIEVVDREEVEEKLLMTPGDIAMLLNETAGLRVQVTSPSLGGAGVRVQGLRPGYTQILTDGLPLHGGLSGGLGLLQIPPMDLQRVEVIKGAASALYGSQALGGVINLVSRAPGAEPETELLLNHTTRDGRDAILWNSAPLGATWGYTLLAGHHTQRAHDRDGDGWADLAGYERTVVRPRLHWEDGAGRSLLATVGATTERRRGGTLPGRLAPDGAPFVESLDTDRADAGVTFRTLAGTRTLLGVRGALSAQWHGHRFGDVRERDAHRTAFGEATARVQAGPGTWVLGAALHEERYSAQDVPVHDFTHGTRSLFVQFDGDPAPWLSVGGGLRYDAHGTYGDALHPRASILLRAPDAGALTGWTLRASGATGASAPTPFTEETEVTGLSPVRPLAGVRPERARNVSLDLEGPVGPLALHATLFASVVDRPLVVREVIGGAFPAALQVANAPGPTRTQGAELYARWEAEPFVVNASYTFVRASRSGPRDTAREPVPLVPRHAAGIVAMREVEEVGRLGLELYYTGRQALDDDPYAATSRPYLVVGLLVERRVGPVTLFVNLENLGDVRQTRWAPLVRPLRGAGGRWTTDAWTELAGRTINGGLRWRP